MVDRKADPIGRCADCRWSQDLPEKMIVGPYVLDCRALPPAYTPRPVESKLQLARPATGVPQLDMIRYVQHKKADDFCVFFQSREA